MQRFFKNKKLLWGAAGVLVVIIGITAMFAKNGNGNYELFTVERRSVVEEVIISGTVEADIVSNLGFETSGAVRDIFVRVNDTVAAGALLARLGLGTLEADLQSAQANVAIKKAQNANTTVNLDLITQKQDTFVANAWSELLSDGVVAEPQSVTYTQTPPIITGRYSGEAGTYKIRILSGVQQTRMELYVFGLENIAPIEINKTGSTPIGSGGLSVSFPDLLSTYDDTIWYITLPNEHSASYAGNYSAWESAVRERARAIEEAESALRSQSSGSSISEAELARAYADVARIQAQINERTLTAPFSGIVTAVDISPGETVNVGKTAISLISQGGFGVEIDLPEIDSVKVKVGDSASVVLDALPSEVFLAQVASVNRTETLVDGISVYEARVVFDTQDERIASGMTAEVTIITDERAEVLAVPSRAIKYHEDGVPYVMVIDITTEKPLEVDVTLGIRGSDGFVEVLNGLAPGDLVRIAS